MMEVIPTVVPNSLEDVEALVARCRSFANSFHIDAADGTLAPNKTWVPTAGQRLPEVQVLEYEAHLMVAQPEAMGTAFASAGAARIIAHVEAFSSEEQAKTVFASWRSAGVRHIGLAALIDTPLEALDTYIFLCDSVTLMSIASVGVQGMPFDERGYGRVADLHMRYPELLIEVDGGVGAQQIAALARAGATRFSVGSAISRSSDPSATHRELLELAQKAL